jgi:hypothetical protein
LYATNFSIPGMTNWYSTRADGRSWKS